MISQNNKLLGSEINNWGCLFMALLATKHLDWQVGEVVDIFLKAKKLKIIGDKCYINSMDELLKLIESPYRWASRQAVEGGKVPSYSIAICRYKTDVGHHFMLHHQTIIYNPYYAAEATYVIKSHFIDRVDLLKKIA